MNKDRITRASDVPDAHKIAAYDALCKHFEQSLDRYYTYAAPQDPRYDTGVAAEQTECVGIEVDGSSLYVVMAMKGWADLHGFTLELPLLTRDDHIDEGTSLTLLF